jgi:cytochrome P450
MSVTMTPGYLGIAILSSLVSSLPSSPPSLPLSVEKFWTNLEQCLLFFYRIFYNLFLHPLRRFPGPKLAAITKFQALYYRGVGKAVAWNHELHQKYGPVVRVTPNELSFIQPEAWRDINGHRIGGKPNFTKDATFYGRDFFLAEGESGGIIRSDDVSHARQRRLISAAFSDKSLREQEPLLRQYVDTLVSKLSEMSKAEDDKVNIVDWYNFTTFDIMADLTFGEPLHLLDKGDYSTWVRALFSAFKFLVFQQVARSIPGLEAVLQTFLPKSVQEKKERHLKFATERVDKRLQMKTDRPDIWTYVLRFSNSEENKDRGLSMNEMYSNSSTFMLAGTETTATLLSGVTYMLLKHPTYMKKLVAEIRETFPTRESITLQKLALLEYLNACIEEALRLYPPVAVGMPRIVPAQGAVICDEEIPGGVSATYNYL